MSGGGIMFVGESDDLPGFRLGGLKNVRTIREENANEVFEALKTFSGLIILTKKAKTLLGGRALTLASDERIIHTLAEKGDEYATIDRIVKDTIGFDLNKKRHG